MLILYSNLNAADNIQEKVSQLHAALTTLKTKLAAVDTGLESIYSKLNPGKPSLFVAQFMKRLTSPAFDDLTIESQVQNYDDAEGKFSANLTYQIDKATKAEVEFLHNRDSRKGSITMQLSGSNDYARWEKISDYANTLVVLIGGFGGVMSVNSTGVAFTWQFEEKKWYSQKLDILLKIIMNLAQATGGLSQKVIDPVSKKEKFEPGNVLLKQRSISELLRKKILRMPLLKNSFKNHVLNYSLNGSRYHNGLLQALDFIPDDKAGDDDWEKVLKIIKRFFEDNDYARESNLFYFKACHASSLVGVGEVPIADYDVLTLEDLIQYDQDPAQDFVKKVAKVSHFLGAPIQSIINKIVSTKLHEKMSEKTIEQFLDLIERHADFFASCGSWDKGKLGVNKVLNDLLSAPQVAVNAEKVGRIRQAIGCLGYLSLPDSLRKKNADYFLMGVPLSESFFEEFLNNKLYSILSEKSSVEIIKQAYEKLPECVRMISEDQLAMSIVQNDSTLRKNSAEIIAFLNQDDVYFRSRVISTAILKKTENFAWINKSNNQWIGGMAKPKSELHLEMLKSLNVGLLVSLQKVDFTQSPFQDSELENVYLPVPDFKIPTIDQVNQFVQRADYFHAQGRRVIVHCTAGIGRTGTLLACWFVVKKNMTAKQAITAVRKFRPGSIETQDQMKFVSDYYESLK